MKINRFSGFKLLTVVMTVIAFIQLFGRVKAAPPLPFHTIEGVRDGAITPMAYLANPEPK